MAKRKPGPAKAVQKLAKAASDRAVETGQAKETTEVIKHRKSPDVKVTRIERPT